MIASPSPVQEIAAVASSAHVPAAISGESPTRPGCLPLMPPVEVAAATPPLRVAGDGADGPPRRRRAARRAPRCETSRRARCRGPARGRSGPAGSPTSITCRPSSSTARAAAIGLRMPVIAATAPAARSAPAHDRRVVDDRAALVQRRAAAGVEDRVVLEHDHRRLDRVERVAACVQHRVAGVDRALARPRGPGRGSSGRQVPAPPCTTIAITPGTIRAVRPGEPAARRDDLPARRRRPSGSKPGCGAGSRPCP